MQASTEPINVFVSYSHEDKPLLAKLRAHISILERQCIISGWHDAQITPGKEWAAEIKESLRSASVILLLVSADFLASDYSYGTEMKAALERHNAGLARVVPIILRKVDWQGAPFAHLQALPAEGKTVRSWSDEDEAFCDVAQGIRKVAEDIRAELAVKRKLKEEEEAGIDQRQLTLSILQALSEVYIRHLRYLSRDTPFIAEVHDRFLEELRKLHGLGLITRRKGPYGFRSLQQAPPPRNVKDHFELTKTGTAFLNDLNRGN